MKFDGVDDFITLPAMTVNFSQGITVEAWVWFDAFQTNSRIIDFGNGAPGADPLILFNSMNTNSLYFTTYTDAANAAILNLQKWMHLAVTMDSAGNTVFYKNGQPVVVGQGKLPGSVARSTNYIGKSYWSTDKLFQGKMADIRIWNRARTQAEINANMSNLPFGSENGLVACWALDAIQFSGSKKQITDINGNFIGTVNDGTIIQETLPDFSKLQRVMQFDGSAAFVTLPPMTEDYSKGFTVEAWVWYDAFQYFSRIIEFGNAQAGDNIIFSNIQNNNQFYLTIAYNGNLVSLTAPSNSLVTGMWYHLAGTIDSAGNSALYLNGNPLVAGTLPMPRSVQRINNYIGKSSASPDALFKGKMAELRAWNVARTQSQIQGAMFSRLIGNEDGLKGLWKLDSMSVNGSRLQVNDSTGKYNGIATTTQVVPDTLPVYSNTTKVVQFDGSQTFVTLPSMTVDFSNGFTVEAWVWYDAFQYFSRIIEFGNAQAGDNIIFSNVQNNNQFYLTIAYNGNLVSLTAPSNSLVTGLWYHLAGTIDSTGKSALYINGKPVAAGTLPVPRNVQRINNFIGKSGASADALFKGKITQLRVWNKARSPTDIQANMNISVKENQPGLVASWLLNSIYVNGSRLQVVDSTGNFNGTVSSAFISSEPNLR